VLVDTAPGLLDGDQRIVEPRPQHLEPRLLVFPVVATEAEIGDGAVPGRIANRVGQHSEIPVDLEPAVHVRRKVADQALRILEWCGLSSDETVAMPATG